VTNNSEEPLTKFEAWSIYEEVLDLVISALFVALLVGTVAGVLLGLAFRPVDGLAGGLVAGVATVLIFLFDRRSAMRETRPTGASPRWRRS